MSAYAGIILAGGDGTRLAALTRRLAGDGRPKMLPVSGVGWNDLGDPARVRAIQERIGWGLASA